jgi:hypothetical protein
MKGVIFNLLEDFVTTTWGEVAYEDILGRCPVHARGPHVGPSTYPDADLMAIVAGACARLGVTTDQALQAFGAFAATPLIGKLPRELVPFDHPRDLLLAVDDVIHVEVRKLFRDAEPPRITCRDDGDPTRLTLYYASRRQLCPLLLGLLDGTARHYMVPITYQHVTCSRDGAPRCELDVAFGLPAARTAA